MNQRERINKSISWQLNNQEEEEGGEKQKKCSHHVCFLFCLLFFSNSHLFALFCYSKISTNEIEEFPLECKLIGLLGFLVLIFLFIFLTALNDKIIYRKANQSKLGKFYWSITKIKQHKNRIIGFYLCPKSLFFRINQRDQTQNKPSDFFLQISNSF